VRTGGPTAGSDGSFERRKEGFLMENRIGVFPGRASSQPGAAVSDTLHAAAGLAGLQMARRR
jgi:hypothetical protein